jgi:rhodanese-related sulfurtransferase
MNKEKKTGFPIRFFANRPRFARDVFFGVVLVLAGSGIGVGVNCFREKPLGWLYEGREESLRLAVRKLKAGVEGRGDVGRREAAGEVALEELERWVAGKSSGVLLLDVRPDLFYEMGHIPGAKNFPVMEMEKLYPEHKAAISAASRVVVYCDGTHCGEAENVARALVELGHGNVSVYRGGWTEWNAKR